MAVARIPRRGQQNRAPVVLGRWFSVLFKLLTLPPFPPRMTIHPFPSRRHGPAVLETILIGATSCIATFVIGCGASAEESELPAPADGGSFCPGTVEAPTGLSDVDDPALLAQARGEAGHGGLCDGKVFEALLPLTVYRVWGQSRPSTAELGRWWSFQMPLGPVESYRTDEAICPEWSSLDTLTQCKLTVGARIAVGPGQSANCQDTTYAASPINQVFIPNDVRDPTKQVVYVDSCTPGSSWPGEVASSPGQQR